MISCRQLSRRFGEFTAVDGLTFEVPAGAVCALLGPNGAGKSTTLKMLTGLLAPTSGQASVAGLDVVEHARELKRRIGVLPEDLGLFDDLTVEEHLLLTGDVYGVARREAHLRATQLLHALDLDHGRHVFAGHCSHGMRKKTALAMALLPNPEVLFLDEPFEAIDPATARTLSALLSSMARRGVTVFLTSHILTTVEKVASEILILRAGKTVWQSETGALPGPLEELYFDVLEIPDAAKELAWLGSRPS